MTTKDANIDLAIIVIGVSNPDSPYSYESTTYHRGRIGLITGIGTSQRDALVQPDIPPFDKILQGAYKQEVLHPEHRKFSRHLDGVTKNGNRSLFLQVSSVVVLTLALSATYFTLSMIMGNAISSVVALLIAFLARILYVRIIWKNRRTRLFRARVDQINLKDDIVSDSSYEGCYVEIDSRDESVLQVNRVLSMCEEYNSLLDSHPEKSRKHSDLARNFTNSSIESLTTHNQISLLEQHAMAIDQMQSCGMGDFTKMKESLLLNIDKEKQAIGAEEVAGSLDRFRSAVLIPERDSH